MTKDAELLWGDDQNPTSCGDTLLNFGIFKASRENFQSGSAAKYYPALGALALVYLFH